MTLKEMAALQGIDLDQFRKMVSDQEMGKQIGNAMSVPVMGAVIWSAPKAAGIVSVDDGNISQSNREGAIADATTPPDANPANSASRSNANSTCAG